MDIVQSFATTYPLSNIDASFAKCSCIIKGIYYVTDHLSRGPFVSKYLHFLYGTDC